MKTISPSLTALSLLTSSLLALALPASANVSVPAKHPTVCVGEKKCIEEKTLAAVHAMLAQQKSSTKNSKPITMPPTISNATARVRIRSEIE